jgi:demethylmenaquinone methyltransferase/2-methoxy-6-polyprenyl-1,4-benzoquinol methylase
VSLDSAFDTPDTKRRYVRRLFSTIADRYDLITAVLSYGQDARWKRKLVELADVRKGERALDLACGTGDIAFAVAARGARTAGLDITHRMLQLARAKSTAAAFLAGDMASLPVRSASCELVTTGYGLRNVPDLDTAIDEIARVLKPGGRLLSLDFNRPESAIVRAAYLSYLTIVGSILGWILHRDPDTYRYIPASIRRYPGARGVADRLGARGFDHVTVVPLFFGLMSLHMAERSAITNAPRKAETLRSAIG